MPMPLGFGPVRTSTLQCSNLKELGHWSLTLHASQSTFPLEGPEMASLLVERWFDRLDPFWVLYTESEVVTLKEDIDKQWNKVIQQGDCTFFENWLARYPQLARQRANRIFSNLLPKLKNVRWATLKEGNEEFAAYAKPASSETELQARLLSYGKFLLASASVPSLKAYEGDAKQFLDDSVEELHFMKIPSTAEMLAKVMLGTLDPYSSYLSENEFEQLYEDLEGSSEGLGIAVRKVPSGLLIEKIIEGSSAANNREIQVGDIILSVNGISLREMPALRAYETLRSQKTANTRLQLKKLSARGNEITLDLKRTNYRLEEGRIELSIHHPDHHPETDIAYIEVPSFYGPGNPGSNQPGCAEDMKSILMSFKKRAQPLAAIVLDLRGNPGGYLEEAVKMASLFVGDRPVVAVIEGGTKQILKQSGQQALYNGPIVALVDKESASAAEVLAAALSDYQRAILIGSDHTYGKGSIQRLFQTAPFASSQNIPGTVKLTTSYYYSPLGYTPQEVGIRTHITLKGFPPVTELPKKRKNSLVHWPTQVAPLLTEAEIADLRRRQQQMRPQLALMKNRWEKFSQKRTSKTHTLQEAIEIAYDTSQLPSSFSELSSR